MAILKSKYHQNIPEMKLRHLLTNVTATRYPNHSELLRLGEITRESPG